MVDIPEKNQYAHGGFLLCTVIIGAFTLPLLGTTLPDLLCIMDTDLKSASVLFTTCGFGRFLISFVGIFISDKLDITLAIVLALVGIAVSQTVAPNSTFLPLTTFTYLLAGCCDGIITIGRYTLASILCQKTNCGYHFLSCGVAIASLTAPLFGSLFVHGKQEPYVHFNSNISKTVMTNEECTTNIHFAFLIISVLSLLVAVGFMINYHSLANKGISLDRGVLGEDQYKLTNKPLLHNFFFTLVMCTFATITASMTSVFSLMVTYGIPSRLHLDVKIASAMTSSFSICLLCSRVFCTFIADRVKPAVILGFCLSVCLFSSVIFIVYKDSSMTMLSVITVLNGIGTGPMFTCLVLWAKTHVALSSRFICIMLVMDNIGNLVHPTITGILMDVYGPNMFIYTIAGTRFFQLVLFGALNIVSYNIKRE